MPTFNIQSEPANLYPRIDPRSTGRLHVSDLHEIYWEEFGNPNGIPVIGLHGGPGGGGNSEIQRFFNPSQYKILLFDQRGCGRSSPHSELKENTTWDLVNDMEALRKASGIKSWLLFGGSWGTTLALAYAAKHRQHVTGMILRGIFLLTKAELHWFYQNGASQIFPDAYEKFTAPIPKQEQHNMIGAYHKRLTGNNPEIRAEAATAWAQWEGNMLSMHGPTIRPSRFNNNEFQDAFSRIECHYFLNKGFFEYDGWLLDQAAKFGPLPGIIVHGRYDMITPLSSAWALKKMWPAAHINIVPDAGHSSMEPGIVRALIAASDRFANHINNLTQQAAPKSS